MGGMAEVFLARAEGQERLVAIKRILPNIAADDEFIAMFIDEAKIAGQLTHANVAQIIDIGKISGSYFIAMEYVSGHDLRAVWDRTREQAQDAGDAVCGLPIGVACHIVKKLSEGLDFAHRRRDPKGRPLGIIHRDVSPQNILISYDGDLKVIDFGIAKAANRIAKTQTGILKGKFAYMAPEQARGEPIDHRSDIFAIGVVLYELLTGERAFKGDTDFALLEKVRRVDVVPPKTLRPDLPKELERIVMKALGKEASERYAWASVLASDLDRFLSDQGISTSREELGAYVRRNFRAELAEENRRLGLYARQSGSGTRSRKKIDGNGATVVRGGPTAKNGSRSPSRGEPSADSTAVLAAVDASELDEIGADELDDPPPLTTPDLRRPVNVDNKTGAELAALRDQAVKVARATAEAPSSSKASSTLTGPDDAGLISSPSRRQRRGEVPAAAPRTEATKELLQTTSGSKGNNNVVIVVACLLGALLGAVLGVGISLASRGAAADTLVVTMPRQAEVKLGDAVVCAQTPCALYLGKGRHELLLQAPGAEAVTRVVEVGDGPAVLDVVLSRTARAIRVESDPPGAAVLLDEVPLADLTPTTLPPLAVGKQVQLVLTRDGFEALTAVRTVEGDAVWHFDMPTPTTTYTLSALPADAFIDTGAAVLRPLPPKGPAGRVVVIVGKRALAVKVSRPGCDAKSLSLSSTGKATSTQAIKLECRDFDGRISIQAPKRPVLVKIDGVTLPRSADLSAYPLPAGTWNVALVSPRGKRETQVVEVVPGINTPVISRAK